MGCPDFLKPVSHADFNRPYTVLARSDQAQPGICLQLLYDRQGKVSTRMRRSSGRDIDKTVAPGLQFTGPENVRCPTVDNSAVSFECKVIGEFKKRDHTVFFGEVVAARGHPDEQKHIYVTHNFTTINLGNEG